MVGLQFARVFLHVLVGVLTCACIFPFTKDKTHKRLIRRWSYQLLGIFHIKLKVIDRNLGAENVHGLIVANHVSWLDIFVMNALQPCHFVAKSDIRSWPIAGWLSAKTGTIFLARGKQRDVRRIYEGLVLQIQQDKRIAFFPEGTTGAQGGILPFHSNLFEAAIEAQVPVLPFAIRYIDQYGSLQHAVDYIGEMTFMESMKVILQARETTAELILLPAIATDGAHRRELAQAARQVIAQELGVSIETIT